MRLRFKKTWEITALAKLRNAQLDGARAGLLVTVAEAVAVVDTLGRAFAVAGTAQWAVSNAISRCAASHPVS
jgi:hypothetical protein